MMERKFTLKKTCVVVFIKIFFFFFIELWAFFFNFRRVTFAMQRDSSDGGGSHEPLSEDEVTFEDPAVSAAFYEQVGEIVNRAESATDVGEGPLVPDFDLISQGFEVSKVLDRLGDLPILPEDRLGGAVAYLKRVFQLKLDALSRGEKVSFNFFEKELFDRLTDDHANFFAVVQEFMDLPGIDPELIAEVAFGGPTFFVVGYLSFFKYLNPIRTAVLKSYWLYRVKSGRPIADAPFFEWCVAEAKKRKPILFTPKIMEMEGMVQE